MENTTLLIALIATLLVVVVVFCTGLFILLRRTQGGGGGIPLDLQPLNQTIQQSQAQMTVIAEKLTHLEPVTQLVGSVQVELRGLSERVRSVEQNQAAANQGLGTLSTGLAQTGSAITSEVARANQQSAISLHQVSTQLTSEITNVQKESGTSLAELKTTVSGLLETAQSIRAELAQASTGLAELHAKAQARQDIEQRTADSIRRLEAIIAGTQSKGSAGENILEIVFAKLPVEWQVRDFHVAGKAVEFGLRLPNGLILPIDSKWAATQLIEQFVASEDVAEQQQLKLEIEKRVLEKAREVRKYIDPNQTVPFGIAAVPDAVYDLCGGMLADAFDLNVVVISYSLFLPYLLLVFQTVLKSGQSIDLSKLDAYVHTVQDNIKAIQEELDGRFSKAITMLNNSRDEIRAHLSKAGSSLTGLQLNTTTTSPALPEPTGISVN